MERDRILRANAGGCHAGMGMRTALARSRNTAHPKRGSIRGAIPFYFTIEQNRPHSGRFSLSVQKRDIPLESLEKELLVAEERVKRFLAVQQLERRP